MDEGDWEDEGDWPEQACLDLTTLEIVLQEKAEKMELSLATFMQKPDEWIKINFDSGAAVSALPKKFAPGSGLSSNGRCYKTASGDLIQDAGAIKFSGEDENGNKRGVKGRLMDVHTPLVSASEAAKAGQNAWLTKGGGWLIPQNSRVSKKIEHLLSLEAARNSHQMLPVYEDQGVYNFYMQMGKSGSIAPLEEPKLEDCTKAELVKMIKDMKTASSSSVRASAKRRSLPLWCWAARLCLRSRASWKFCAAGTINVRDWCA